MRPYGSAWAYYSCNDKFDLTVKNAVRPLIVIYRLNCTIPIRSMRGDPIIWLPPPVVFHGPCVLEGKWTTGRRVISCFVVL